MAPKDWPNGAILFCSEDVAEHWYPPAPLKGTKYWCDDHFDTSELRKVLDASRTLAYGVVVIDGSEAVLGTLKNLHGYQSVNKVARVRPPRPIPSETRRGGQSALRYERLREEARLEFLRCVVEKVVQTIEGVPGLILAGKADMKRRLAQELPRPLRGHIVSIVDLACDACADNALLLAADLAKESLNADASREAEQAVSRFIEMTNTNPELCCYGEAQTKAALEMGVVEELLVDMSRSGESCGLAAELMELADVYSATIVRVEPRSEVSMHFCKGFGVGGRLRWPLDLDLHLEDSEDFGDSKHFSTSTSLQIHSDSSAQSENCKPVSISVPVCSLGESSIETVAGQMNISVPHYSVSQNSTISPSIIVLAWLKEQLSSFFGDSWEVDSLLAGVEVILGGEAMLEQEDTDDIEALNDVSEMLTEEGVPEPIVIEFARRWAEMKKPCC
jgi:stalled ribosome rescue protein Dom34